MLPLVAVANPPLGCAAGLPSVGSRGAGLVRKRHQMEPLIDQAWRLYTQTSDPCVVRPSIPILYFGNLPRYAASPLKAITVALNPSHHEFPVHDRFARFRPAASIAAGTLDPAAQMAYCAALDGYFLDQ